MARAPCILDAEYLFTATSGGRTIAIYEVTVCVTDGQFLMRPDARCVELINGVFGRTQAAHDFELYGFEILSTHGHWLVGFECLDDKADVHRYLCGNLAREVNRHRKRGGSFFDRRNRPIQVASEEHVVDRLKYIIGQSVAAHVVDKPEGTPFASSNSWLLQGKAVMGAWVHWTEYGEAERRGLAPEIEEFTTRYEVRIDKLPHLRHLSDADYQAMCRRLASEAADAARRERRVTRRPLSGRAAARARDPFERQPRDRRHRSAAPRLHGSQAQRLAHRERAASMREAAALATASWRRHMAGEDIEPLPYPAGTLPPGTFHNSSWRMPDPVPRIASP